MGRKSQNRPQKGGKTRHFAPTPSSQGQEFAEPALQDQVLSSEVAVRQMLLSLSDLQGFPNPDPILRAEGKSIETYRSFRDDHLSAVWSKRLAAVAARPWAIERGKTSSRLSDKIQGIFDNLDVRTITESALECRPMGYCVQEIVWGIVGGLIAPVKIIKRPQEWFAFGLRGETRFIGESGIGEVQHPLKYLITRHKADYLNPYGQPILSECFWPLAFKRGSLRFWMLFVEKFGLPKAVGEVPPGMSDRDKADLLIRLESMVRSAAVVIPNNSKVSLLETKTAAGDLPHPELVRWAENAMSKAFLGEVMTTGAQGYGTYGALQGARDDRAELALDDASLVEGAHNQLINWIWQLNSLPDPKPWLQIQMPEDMQLGRLQRDKGLYALGWRPTQEYFQDVYNIAPEHTARIDPGSGQNGSTTADPGAGASFGEAGDAEIRQDQVLQGILSALPDQALSKQGKELAQPILDMATRSSGYAEFEQMLATEFAEMAPSNLESVMEQFCTLSELAGATDSALESQRTLASDA